MLIKGLRVGNDASKEGVNTAMINMVGEFIVDIIDHGWMYSLLMRNIRALTSLIGLWTHGHNQRVDVSP